MKEPMCCRHKVQQVVWHCLCPTKCQLYRFVKSLSLDDPEFEKTQGSSKLKKVTRLKILSVKPAEGKWIKGNSCTQGGLTRIVEHTSRVMEVIDNPRTCNLILRSQQFVSQYSEFVNYITMKFNYVLIISPLILMQPNI